MSFRSRRQQRFFFAAERDGRLARGTAKDWADETDFSTLPEKASGLAHAHESARGASDAQLRAGIKIEMEHTDDPNTARQIALDHLRELPDYYTRLKAMESAGEKTARVATVKQLKKWKLQGHRTYRGLKIAVENKKGSKRHWHDAHNNTSGSTTMVADYGFVQGSMGMDGEEVDCYVGDDAEATHVYVIDQMKTPDFKKFDEQKCMIGFPSAEAAEAAYRKQYNKPGFFGSMKAMPFDEFKEKVMAKKYDGVKIARVPTEKKQRRRAMEMLVRGDHSFHESAALPDIVRSGKVRPGEANVFSPEGAREVYLGAGKPAHGYFVREHSSGVAVPTSRILTAPPGELSAPRIRRPSHQSPDSAAWTLTPHDIALEAKDALIAPRSELRKLSPQIREQRLRSIPLDYLQDAMQQVNAHHHADALPLVRELAGVPAPAPRQMAGAAAQAPHGRAGLGLALGGLALAGGAYGLNHLRHRSQEKTANGDMLQYFADHPEKLKEKRERDREKGAGLLHSLGLLRSDRPASTRSPFKAPASGRIIMKLSILEDEDRPVARKAMLRTLEHMERNGKLSEVGKAALPFHRSGEHDRIHDDHFTPGDHLEAQDFFERAMGWVGEGVGKTAADYRATLAGTKEFRRAVLGAAEKNLASHLPELAKREGYSVATALTGKGKGELGHRFARGAVRETIDGTSIGKALGSIKKAALSPALLSSLTHGAAGAGIGAAAGGVGGALHAGEGHRAQGFRRGALVGAGLGAAGGVGVSALKGQGGRQLASLQQAAAGAHDEATAIHQGLKNWTPVPGVGGAPHAPARVPVDVNASTVRAQAAGTPTAATMAGRPGVRPAPTAAPRADMATGVARPGATPGRGPRPDSVIGDQGRQVMSPEAWGYRQTEGGGVVRKTPAPAATVAPQAAAVAPTPSHYRMPTETQAASAGGRAEALRQAANTLGQQQGVMNTNINRAAMVGAAGGTGLMGYMAVPQQYGGVAPQKTASGDMLQYFADHPEKLEEKRMRDKAKQKTASYAAARVIAMSGGDISWYEEQEKAAATKEQIHDGVDNAGLALMAAPYLVKTVADLAERRNGAAAHDVSEGVHALKPEITKAVKAAKPGMLRGISNALHSAEHIIEPLGLAMVSPFVGKRLANRFGKDEDKTAGVGSSLGRLVRGAGEHVDELAHMGKNLVAAPGRRIGNMQHAAREEMAAFRSARAGVPHRPLPPTIDPTPRPTVSARVPPTAQGLGPAGPQAPMSPTAKGLAALEQTAGPRTGGFEVPTKAPPVPATAPGVPTTAPGAPGAPGTGVVDRIRSGVRRYGVPLAGAGMLAGGGLAYGGVNLGANVLNHAVPEGPLDIPTVQGQRGVFAR